MKSVVEITTGTQGQENTSPAGVHCCIGKSAFIITNSGFELDITSKRKVKYK